MPSPNVIKRMLHAGLLKTGLRKNKGDKKVIKNAHLFVQNTTVSTTTSSNYYRMLCN